MHSLRFRGIRNCDASLCVCGRGSKISTPLGATEWSKQTKSGPTLRPSVETAKKLANPTTGSRAGKL
jgi:hypothetical protein